MGISAPRTGSTVEASRTQVSATTAAQLSSKVRQELHCEFESAVAFADYCSYLTAGLCRERAAELIQIAEALMTETTAALTGADRPS